jgi:hypothetical protein
VHQRDDEELERARAAKETTTRLARKIRGVNGIGITKLRGRYAVKVSIAEAKPTGLPETVDGVPLVIEVVGPVRKQHAKARER